MPLSYSGQLIPIVILGKTTTFLRLQIFKETHSKHIFTLSVLIDLTNPCIVTAQNVYVTEKRENIEINNVLHRRKKMYSQPIKNMDIIF